MTDELRGWDWRGRRRSVPPPMTEEEQGEVLEQDKEMGDNETEPTADKDEL